jgi:hypothetical protein
MLVNQYVDAFIADEKAADEVWTLWDWGVISDDQAALAWLVIAAYGPRDSDISFT